MGILWISVCSFWLCGSIVGSITSRYSWHERLAEIEPRSIVANPIIYRHVPRPLWFEIRQWILYLRCSNAVWNWNLLEIWKTKTSMEVCTCTCLGDATMDSAPSCDHFSRHGEWKKILATKNSGESRQLATNRLREKLIWKIINNRTNLINSTSDSHTCLSLFPSRRSETRHESVNLLQQSKVLKTCRAVH